MTTPADLTMAVAVVYKDLNKRGICPRLHTTQPSKNKKLLQIVVESLLDNFAIQLVTVPFE